MSRPVIIRNGSKSIQNISDKSDKLIELGNQYHIYFNSLDIPCFDISIDDYGGVVTIKNKPIGVIGVPSSVTGDNSIRVISLFNMDYNNPDSGTSSTDLTMRHPDEYFLNYKSLFTGPRISNNNKVTSYTGTFVDGWHDHNVTIQLSDNNTPGWRTSYTIANSELRNRKNSPAALCTWRYNPAPSVLNMQGYWYMPSMHELIEEGAHLSQIDAGALIIKNTYNIGIGRIPCDTTAYTNPKSYWSSTYLGDQVSYGGNAAKYDVKFQYSRSQYYGSAQDPGMVQAWCKLIKENGKWILDPTYHIV